MSSLSHLKINLSFLHLSLHYLALSLKLALCLSNFVLRVSLLALSRSY